MPNHGADHSRGRRGKAGLDILDTALNKLQNRAAVLVEGDVFETLKSSPWIVRSFELAVVDGAVICSQPGFMPTDSYASRFSLVEQNASQTLLPFDVKSKLTVDTAGHYVSGASQSRWAAFYMGVCVGDPSFIELIPNHRQKIPPPSNESDLDLVAVGSSGTPALPSSTYGNLSPQNSPYRLPLTYLNTAIERIRDHANGKSIYVNPWTDVEFKDWKPTTTESCHILMPSEKSQTFAPYTEVMEICWATRNSPQIPLTFDFVGVQPDLADFKLLCPTAPGQTDQYFVQHKLDGRWRGSKERLTSVSVARSGKRKDGTVYTRWYFSCTDRFDFLLYQFKFLTPDRRGRIEFFFLPEHVVPDHLYTDVHVLADFEAIPEFRPYRFMMDERGIWLRNILSVVEGNPQPRRATRRPRRVVSRQEVDNHDKAVSSDAMTSGQLVLTPRGHEAIHVLRKRQIFFHVMRECATRGSGLLIVLPTRHPLGDYAFCRYQWTQHERDQYLLDGITPRAIHHLPPHTPLVALHIITRDLECDWQGPSIRAATFRRLNSCSERRLVIVDVFGSDEELQARPLAVVPSEDIQPTELQRDVYRNNLSLTPDDFPERAPSIHFLLGSGLTLSDYTVGPTGPLVYDAFEWASIWSLLLQFTTQNIVQHPTGRDRQASLYRHALRKVHEQTLSFFKSPTSHTETNDVHAAEIDALEAVLEKLSH